MLSNKSESWLCCRRFTPSTTGFKFLILSSTPTDRAFWVLKFLVFCSHQRKVAGEHQTPQRLYR